jgi:4-amino-4-deoxy-L-arabinose transferase-like glycosyltransferase
MKAYQKLILIMLGALALRVACLVFIQHPGVADPNHYYNLGARLAEGDGFTIDYIWHYKQPPASIVHPDDYWVPLAGILAAIPMKLLGVSVQYALIPFILIGSIIPALAYAIARQFDCSEATSLFAAAASAALPEYVLNSVRTDTTIVNVLLVCSSLYLMTRGFQRGGVWNFVGSGLAAGLAYLTRNDSSLLLPVLALFLVIYLYRRQQPALRLFAYAAVTVVVAVLVVLPWLIRNQRELGTMSPPGLSSMFFYTAQAEDFAYDRQFTLQTMLASQTIPQLIGKRLFELAASVKLSYTALDVFLPVALYGGLILLVMARDHERLVLLAPALIWLVAIFITYPILVPFKSQSGSFKKAFLTIIPMLLPLAGYGLEKAVANARIRGGVMILAVVFTGANGFELVRADARATNNYLAAMRSAVAVANTLPDTNGDGQIILMTQDPFMVRFLGLSSVMLPYEDRDTILKVAQRYHVDYLLMPPDRPSLDPIYLGDESDKRFVAVRAVPPTSYVFYKFDFEAG